MQKIEGVNDRWYVKETLKMEPKPREIPNNEISLEEQDKTK
jgi:hypothetical protein